MHRFYRLLKHLFTTQLQLKRAFPHATLNEIEHAIRQGEKNHAGEVRFAVESSLEPIDCLKGLSPRARAIELFSNLHIWDTEQNCGLLIYVLIADRAVEIVADRGVSAKVGDAEWSRICHLMEIAFKKNDFRGGVLKGIADVSQHLTTYYPVSGFDRNELSDRPVVL